MGDITFMKGYGFPRGSRMDYAGYASHSPLQIHGRMNGFGGLLVNNRRFRAAPSIPYAPEPGIFSKIPALDGMDEFGTEYTFEPEEPITPGPMYGPEYRPDQLGMSTGKKVAMGLGLLGLLYLVTR